MKKTLLICAALFLAACSSQPNLVHTQNPILNIDSAIASLIEADVSSHKAWVKNQSEQAFKLKYAIFWYADNGVTQPVSDKQEAFTGTLLLQPKQKHVFELVKPTPESVNYRLYLR